MSYGLHYGEDQAFESPSPTVLAPQVLSELELRFTLEELTDYAERRKYGLSTYSIDWIDRARKVIWDYMNGTVSKDTVDKLRLFVLHKYRSESSHTKVLSFAKAFLKFLTKARLDTRYYAFEVTVGQFREALQSDTPCIEVLSSQDKIHMSHYVPLHPQVVQAIHPLLGGRSDVERMFEYVSLLQWVKRAKIPLTRIPTHFRLGDLRKWTEQHSDIIGGWEPSNRAYVLTHGVSGVDWKHYKHPLRESVYSIYMKCWGDVRLALSSSFSQ